MDAGCPLDDPEAEFVRIHDGDGNFVYAVDAAAVRESDERLDQGRYHRRCAARGQAEERVVSQPTACSRLDGNGQSCSQHADKRRRKVGQHGVAPEDIERRRQSNERRAAARRKAQGAPVQPLGGGPQGARRPAGVAACADRGAAGRRPDGSTSLSRCARRSTTSSASDSP
jgi:hypothetical protein